MKKLLDLWNIIWVCGLPFILIVGVILYTVSAPINSPKTAVLLDIGLSLFLVFLVLFSPGMVVFVAGALSGLPIGLGIYKIQLRKKNESLAPGIILLILGVGLFVSLLFTFSFLAYKALE